MLSWRSGTHLNTHNSAMWVVLLKWSIPLFVTYLKLTSILYGIVGKLLIFFWLQQISLTFRWQPISVFITEYLKDACSYCAINSGLSCGSTRRNDALSTGWGHAQWAGLITGWDQDPSENICSETGIFEAYLHSMCWYAAQSSTLWIIFTGGPGYKVDLIIPIQCVSRGQGAWQTTATRWKYGWITYQNWTHWRWHNGLKGMGGISEFIKPG